MQPLTKGHYRARLAGTQAEIRAAQRLRHIAFRPVTPPHAAENSPAMDAAPLDADDFDTICRHVLIEDLRDGALVGCFRGLGFGTGREIEASYSAQFYDLSSLSRYGGRMIEIGRFCIHPQRPDPDILRLAWAFLARHVAAQGIEMMFGCSSFNGTDKARYEDSFALLRAGHLAPAQWRPKIKAAQVYHFAERVRHLPDRRKALQAMPPLLRTYLMMGGWVSDHAVIDKALDRLHVFTGVEIRTIPEARRNLLLALAR